MFYSATIHWAEMREAILRRFMTPSFPSTMSLTLDGVTSFSCVINIRNMCKRLSYSQTVGGISSVQWQKVEESEGYNCFFIIFSSPEPLGSLVSF